MSDPALASYYQHRMTTAYQEQIWAVTIVGAMNAFIASHAGALVRSFPLWQLLAGVSLAALGALGIVLSRHVIFVYHDEEARLLLAVPPMRSTHVFGERGGLWRWLARWSGVVFYSLIIFVLWGIAWRLLTAASRSGT
jgi:hypothetical protein